jgi:Methyltransferase FkbM domain
MVNQFRNIEIVQAAATDKTGLLKYFHNFSNGNVAGMESPRPEDILSAETVMGLRVDDIVSESARIGFLKIDVEGYEYKAFRGARKTLERNRPVITSEFCPGALEARSGLSRREYLEFLVSLGYEVLVLTDEGPVRGDIADALRRFEQRGSDHIDLLLLPVPLQSS